jgi:tRNA pseudouridine13 synthase
MLNLSKGSGTGGAVKSSPEDFIVKEILQNGRILECDKAYTAAELGQEEAPEGKFTTLVLQKTNWNTIQALTTIAKRLGHGKGSISYAGTKDRTSVSVQLASIYGTTPEKVMEVRMKDIKINGAWLSNGVELGSNLGNAFAVRIREARNPENAGRIIEELDGRMPNYFDKQRFGSRLNNAKVGLRIMKDDFESALDIFLTDSSNEENRAAIEARSRLAEEDDYKAALEYFPRHLKGEITAIAYMAQYDNPANALRKLPKGIRIMFIHAVQALVFNLAVEERIKGGDFESSTYCKENFYGFPDVESVGESRTRFSCESLVGYETDAKQISDYAAEAMEKLGVGKDDFKIKGMPELSMKGAFRPIIAPVKDLSYETSDALKLGFSIPAGSYATILLNEVTKSETRDLSVL